MRKLAVAISVVSIIISLLSFAFTYEAGHIRSTGESSFIGNMVKGCLSKSRADDPDIPYFMESGKFVNAYGKGNKWTARDHYGEHYFTEDGGKNWNKVVKDK